LVRVGVVLFAQFSPLYYIYYYYTCTGLHALGGHQIIPAEAAAAIGLLWNWKFIIPHRCVRLFTLKIYNQVLRDRDKRERHNKK
jgi:hypothetical protein